MKKLDPSHPAYAKVQSAEKRHSERIKDAAEMAPKRAIPKKRKRGVAFSSKL